MIHKPRKEFSCLRQHAARERIFVDLSEEDYESLSRQIPFGIGTEYISLVSMKPQLVFNGVPLTEAEIQDLLLQTEGLAQLKGKWIEVDHERLRSLLAQMQKYDGSLTFLEALKLESGMANTGGGPRTLSSSFWTRRCSSISQDGGLCPMPKEINFQCSCPDWAMMCKHVAAVMYGIGVRFDENPFFFFKLRGIDIDRFIDTALENRVESMLSHAACQSSRIIRDADITELFGVL